MIAAIGIRGRTRLALTLLFLTFVSACQKSVTVVNNSTVRAEVYPYADGETIPASPREVGAGERREVWTSKAREPVTVHLEFQLSDTPREKRTVYLAQGPTKETVYLQDQVVPPWQDMASFARKPTDVPGATWADLSTLYPAGQGSVIGALFTTPIEPDKGTAMFMSSIEPGWVRPTLLGQRNNLGDVRWNSNDMNSFDTVAGLVLKSSLGVAFTMDGTLDMGKERTRIYYLQGFSEEQCSLGVLLRELNSQGTLKSQIPAGARVGWLVVAAQRFDGAGSTYTTVDRNSGSIRADLTGLSQHNLKAGYKKIRYNNLDVVQQLGPNYVRVCMVKVLIGEGTERQISQAPPDQGWPDKFSAHFITKHLHEFLGAADVSMDTVKLLHCTTMPAEPAIGYETVRDFKIDTVEKSPP